MHKSKDVIMYKNTNMRLLIPINKIKFFLQQVLLSRKTRSNIDPVRFVYKKNLKNYLFHYFLSFSFFIKIQLLKFSKKSPYRLLDISGASLTDFVGLVALIARLKKKLNRNRDFLQKEIYFYSLFNEKVLQFMIFVILQYMQKIKTKKSEKIFRKLGKNNEKIYKKNGHWVLFKKAIFGRYSFINNLKSKRVAKFISRVTFIFRRTRQSPYFKLFKSTNFPFRIGTKTTNFYLKHKPNPKTVSYNDYRLMKLYFGALKPREFWRRSRIATIKDTMGESFLKKYSYLDLRVDYLIGRLGFAENIFQGREFIDANKILINGRVIQTGGLIVRPCDWIEVIETERVNFKANYLSKLVIQRTQNYRLRPLPSFIEASWSLFRFFILPIITLDDFVRPYKTSNKHVGGGKKLPAKLS